jgi:hypothetical protein
MNTTTLIRQIAASADGVPVRGGLAVGYSQDYAAQLADHDATRDEAEVSIQIRRPDGSRDWVRSKDVRRP